MHIHFIAIGGAGINPLAQMASLAGFKISGSDLRTSNEIDKLKSRGVNIFIGSALEGLISEEQNGPIDWVVYSSAVAMNKENKNLFDYLNEKDIKHSKRDQFLSSLIEKNNQKMIAVAGTHGKTTTTAMMVWLAKKLQLNVNYLVAAELEFAASVEFNPKNNYLIYEADEFDRNFLSFKPEIAAITGLGYDHQEIYPSKESYNDAFIEFINNSKNAYIFEHDQKYLAKLTENMKLLDNQDNKINEIKLLGKYNREDAFLVSSLISQEFSVDINKCIELISEFPGLHRRMEEITTNLYSDYAHTPEKIRAAINVSKEMSKTNHQNVVVVYEPLTNRRQIHIKDQYKDVFDGVNRLYWLPSYLAREDPNDRIISPEELIEGLNNKDIASSISLSNLREIIDNHLSQNDLVVCMCGGGAGGLDEWLRDNY